MSGSAKFSYAEAFLQKTVPSLKHKKKLVAAKSSLRNKPILLVAEKKAKKSNKRPGKNYKVSNRIIAKPRNSDYASYERLRVLWKEYISNVLSDYMTTKTGDTDSTLDIKSAQDVLLKADYHGAEITVVNSPCESLKGISGTVLQETKNVFLICTKKNKILRIPKNKTIFILEYPPGYRVTLFGSHFRLKPSHRLTKKFNKNPSVDELLR